jgi:hypothetical protein
MNIAMLSLILPVKNYPHAGRGVPALSESGYRKTESRSTAPRTFFRREKRGRGEQVQSEKSQGLG